MPARGTSVTILAASLALVGALAACGSDTTTTVAGPTVTATVTETATVTSSPSASATKTAPAGLDCASSEVSAQFVGGDSGAGQRRGTLVLTNTGSRTCAVLGYAGMQLLDANKAKVPTNVVRAASPSPKRVQLKPGAKASSTLTWGVVSAGNEPENGPCEPTAASARVTPPNSTTSVTAAWNLGPVCNKGRLLANALVAGSQG